MPGPKRLSTVRNEASLGWPAFDDPAQRLVVVGHHELVLEEARPAVDPVPTVHHVEGVEEARHVGIRATVAGALRNQPR